MNDSLEVGSKLEVVLTKAAFGGAVSRSHEGRVVFVRHGLPGERVSAVVTEISKKFARADALEILEASPNRVIVPCRFAGAAKCGGCDLQHANVSGQLQWKSDVLAEHLSRIARVDLDVAVIAVPTDPQGSRTRLRCAVNSDGQLGLRQSRRHDIIALDECWIADSRLRSAFDQSWSGFDEIELRAIGQENVFAVTSKFDDRDVEHDIRSLSGDILDAATKSRVEVNGNTFHVGPLSFWQSHRSAPEILTQCVQDSLGAKLGDHVTDLYSGVGLFSVPLARQVGSSGRLVAVEGSMDAANDAVQNANGLSQLTIRQWSVSPRSINDSVSRGDLVILDPPRTGAGKSVMTVLARRRPRRIVYVSCDGATFARDIRILLDAKYRLSKLHAFDLFPMTEHVEIVGVLDDTSE